MARQPRLQIAGGIYHVTSRAVARLPLFREDEDRTSFLAIAGDVVARYGWTCHAFCLMTTHYHLLVRTPDPNLAAGMQRLNSSYACERNRRHGGRGHAFERRYGSELVETEAHLLETSRYIVLNPVRAGVCSSPAEWRWSSYRACAGLAQRPPFLAVESLLAHFGSEVGAARERFRAFVEDAIHEPPHAAEQAKTGALQ